MKKDPSRQSLWGRFFQGIITFLVYIFFRPKVVYADKSLKKRLTKTPCVFVANHTHHFDGAFGGAVLRRYKPWVLVTKKWSDRPAVGRFISWCRSISISLDEADGEWFQISEKIINRGGTLLIFPEGGLSKSGKIEEFKPGAALISAKTGAPIVPCAIYGPYKFFVGRRQRIYIGEPIESNCPPDVRRSKYAKELIAKAQKAVEQNRGILEKIVKNGGKAD